MLGGKKEESGALSSRLVQKMSTQVKIKQDFYEGGEGEDTEAGAVVKTERPLLITPTPLPRQSTLQMMTSEGKQDEEDSDLFPINLVLHS